MNRKHIPEIGKQYGQFTIISEEIGRSNDKKILFKVRCSCNKEQFVRAYFLESGRQTCCKECRSKINYNIAKEQGKRVGFVKLHHEGIGNFTKTAFNHFKRNAKKRNIDWSEELTIDYLYNLLLKQDKKCALTGLDIDLTELRKSSNVAFEFMTASLDRIDSSIGYYQGNVQFISIAMNHMKNVMSDSEVKELLNIIRKK